MSVSDGLVIIGGIAIFVFLGLFFGLDALHIKLEDSDFVSKIIPYILLIGLVALGSGGGIKAYRWKNSSR